MKMTCTEIIMKQKCTGCGACKNICSLESIIMDTDREGFWYPIIDEKKCIHCGKCACVCPVMKENLTGLISRSEDEIKVYAAWSLDQDIRYHSTSGGIFSELALAILAKGGFICGAVYDDQHMVRHYITGNDKELQKLRQSKYVQSDMGDIYKEIGDLLIQGKTLLFCGTPCQCAGVFQYCKENTIDTTDLYLVGFICRGSNSPKVYKKFLKELESKYQASISKVWFKDKTYGWNHFSTRIEFDNGKCYLEDRYHDIYVRGYIEENLYIRPSCADCSFKGLHRIADVTLADFWGVQLKEHMQDSDGGTSVVMIHTEKGKELWNAVSHRVYKTEKKLEDVIPGNVCFGHSVRHGVHREKFMEDLDRMPVIDNIGRFLKINQG